MLALRLRSRILNWAWISFQLPFLWYQLPSGGYYQEQLAIGFNHHQMISDFICQCEQSRWYSMKSVAAGTGKFRWGNRNPQSLCHCAKPSSCLWCTQLLPSLPRGNSLPVCQLPSHILAGYVIPLGPSSKGSADIPKDTDVDATAGSWSKATKPVSSVRGFAGSSWCAALLLLSLWAGSDTPLLHFILLFQAELNRVSNVTCPRPPRIPSTGLGIGSTSPRSQAFFFLRTRPSFL